MAVEKAEIISEEPSTLDYRPLVNAYKKDQRDFCHVYYTEGKGRKQLEAEIKAQLIKEIEQARQDAFREAIKWFRHNKYVKQIPIDETTPIQWVGVYTTRWNKEQEPTYGFYEPDWDSVLLELSGQMPGEE